VKIFINLPSTRPLGFEFVDPLGIGFCGEAKSVFVDDADVQSD
jgi:hypothetical protein